MTLNIYLMGGSVEKGNFADFDEYKDRDDVLIIENDTTGNIIGRHKDDRGNLLFDAKEISRVCNSDVHSEQYKKGVLAVYADLIAAQKAGLTKLIAAVEELMEEAR